MANFPEPVNPGFPSVYEISLDDDVVGGPDGISNRQGKQLVERTAYLKKELENEADERQSVDAHLQQQIDAQKGRGGYLTAHDFGKKNPTQTELTNYALSKIEQTDPKKIWNGTHVKNLNNGHVWVLTNTPNTEPPIFEWTDDGVDSVGIAGNDGTLGIVTGGEGLDEIFIEPITGKMKNNAARAYNADQVDGLGRNLLNVLNVSNIPEAMAELRRLCNNNGEIDSTGVPDFRGLMVGDYLDGLDLSGIGTPTGGTAPQAWSEQYKNNRIVIAGLNTYKSSGDTENIKNHITFVFRNAVCTARMNATNTNTGGYQASELRAWLEGASGDGSGSFAAGLKMQLGGEYLYTIRKGHSMKGSSSWNSYTVWIMSVIELFGVDTYGDELAYWNTNVHFPLHQKSYAYRMKWRNGARQWYWLSTPSASSASYFCYCYNYGFSYSNSASSAGGVAPAFCVA
jgi:hypothetical protein